jgi:hypothetical protein
VFYGIAVAVVTVLSCARPGGAEQHATARSRQAAVSYHDALGQIAAATHQVSPDRGARDASASSGAEAAQADASMDHWGATVPRDAGADASARDAATPIDSGVGSWAHLGVERWRAAIENYVPRVKPEFTRPVEPVAVLFGRFLNAMHNRIHPVFADTFLPALESLPREHPMNRRDISTRLEIILSSVDGQVVAMGVIKTSGVTAFDIGALESVRRAAPFGKPPREIVSADSHVYVHWEFHRNPYYACSTYFARPCLLDSAPAQ